MVEQEQTENADTTKTETPWHTRRGNGLLVFALFAAMVFAVSYKPSVEAIYCNAETLSAKPDVIMLSTSWCPYCYKARRYFVNNEISYCEYNIEKDNKGRKMYDHANRYASQTGMPLGTPVLFIGDHQLSGFDEDRIEELLIKLKLL